MSKENKYFVLPEDLKDAVIFLKCKKCSAYYFENTKDAKEWRCMSCEIKKIGLTSNFPTHGHCQVQSPLQSLSLILE